MMRRYAQAFDVTRRSGSVVVVTLTVINICFEGQSVLEILIVYLNAQ